MLYESMSTQAETHILDQFFDTWKTPILWAVSKNINSNQKPLNEIRMCDIRQIASVYV